MRRPPTPSRPSLRAQTERGAILILTALVMIVLLLIAAFATDLGAWYRQGQEQQRAADVSSLNGVQGYDESIKAYVESKGVNRFSELTAAQQAEAEQQAMQDAVASVIGSLNAGGMNITAAPLIVANTPPAESTATVTAADGTEIVITRTANNGITVNVNREGEQYFSNIVRDAPEISRQGSAVIANCNADCSREIPLEPPFRGFDARGDGDGWAPLLRGDSEIWAVNHHSNMWGFGGSVICMDRTTEDFCNFNVTGASKPGSIPLTGYQTPNRPVEVIDNSRDKIFFSARHQSTAKSGVACIDMSSRSYCSTPFRSIWDNTRGGTPNSVGPIMWNDNLYVVSITGELACVDPDTMALCGTWTMAAASHASMPALNGTSYQNHLELVGHKLYATLGISGGLLFDCWNLQAAAPCWGSTPTSNYVWAGGFTFLGYNAAGTPTHICAAIRTGRNMCADLGNGSTYENAALASYLPALNVGWTGDAFSFVSNGQVRTIFGGGLSNRSVCFDWIANAGCGVVTHPTYTAETLPTEPDGAGRWPSIGGSSVEPYAYELVTPGCIIGLGDEASFFTLTVDTMETCTGSSVTTVVTPCRCADDTFVYGVLELPEDLKAVLEKAQGTVTDGVTVIQGDLLNENLDLSPFNGGASSLELTIDVESKVDGNGVVLWTQPTSAKLSLVVQPTLTGN